MPAWPTRTTSSCRTGEAGELLLRADEPFAFASGYFGMPETDRAGLAQPLVPHRRPRGARQPTARFRFVDRIKDAIRRRGENISSYEVEQVLLSHPAVAGAAVYPVRSELAEDEVMAALVLRGGEPARARRRSRATARRGCRTSRCRATSRSMDDCRAPRTARSQKYKLRERGVTAATWVRPERRRRSKEHADGAAEPPPIRKRDRASAGRR